MVTVTAAMAATAARHNGVRAMGLFNVKKQKKNTGKFDNFEAHVLNEASPFAVQEAYKALRTNVIFSIPEEKCKKIVITSSMQGEAKSTTAVNLAIAFAQNGSKVLLIDGDLRLPTDAVKLGVEATPGISNVLVGMNTVQEAIHHLPGGLDLMPAGDVPPNPTELLGSEKMQKLLESLSNAYEYILLDTPPINTVADASILSKVTSGVIVVVRQNVATQESVAEAIQKLEFADAKILGFVFTGVENEKHSSYKKGNYGYGYGYGYAASQQAAQSGLDTAKHRERK